jgi:hypothetical protein
MFLVGWVSFFSPLRIGAYKKERLQEKETKSLHVIYLQVQVVNVNNISREPKAVTHAKIHVLETQMLSM